MNPRSRKLLAKWLIPAFLVIGLGLAYLRSGWNPSDATGEGWFPSASIPQSLPGTAKLDHPPVASDLGQRVRSYVRSFSNGEKNQRDLAFRDMGRTLEAASSQDAAEVILSFLSTGAHVPTGLPFVVGRDGHLLSSPDLRSYLLDILETIDPDAAEAEARAILEAPTRPDEWAISLRIVCRGAPPDDAHLRRQVLELLSVEDWLDTPTVGYLQAFDASVYAAGTEIVDRLLTISDSQYPPATRYAARLALERTAETGYVPLTRALIQSDHLSSQPKFRASLVARGDVRIESERSVLEEYLRTANPDTEETEAFARYFPNYNQQVSDNLITTDPVTPIDDRIEQDKATYSWILAIRGRSGFSHIRSTLNRVERKLARYLASVTAEPSEDDA